MAVNYLKKFFALVTAGIILSAAELARKIFSGGDDMNTKEEVQSALTKNFPVGTSHTLHNEQYGELIIVSTGIAGNLILYKNFYPAAYIRPETLTAVLNAEEPCPPNENFHKLQKLIKETCAEVIECYSVDELIEFVDMNQDFGK